MRHLFFHEPYVLFSPRLVFKGGNSILSLAAASLAPSKLQSQKIYIFNIFYYNQFIYFQARLQAQQLVDREQKIIHFLEERQEEAIRRIAYSSVGRAERSDQSHSANSLSSTNR